MRSARPELEAESWAYALALYAKAGVAEACLALQNEAGVDVMLLLMATFAATKHRLILTPPELGALDDACRPWRQQVVRKLRTIRTELKTGPEPAPGRATEQLRSQIKALELEAEKLENKLLVECLPQRPQAPEKIRPEQLRDIVNSLVGHFAGQRGTNAGASLSSSIDVIVGAAMQDAS